MKLYTKTTYKLYTLLIMKATKNELQKIYSSADEITVAPADEIEKIPMSNMLKAFATANLKHNGFYTFTRHETDDKCLFITKEMEDNLKVANLKAFRVEYK